MCQRLAQDFQLVETPGHRQDAARANAGLLKYVDVFVYVCVCVCVVFFFDLVWFGWICSCAGLYICECVSARYLYVCVASSPTSHHYSFMGLFRFHPNQEQAMGQRRERQGEARRVHAQHGPPHPRPLLRRAHPPGWFGFVWFELWPRVCIPLYPNEHSSVTILSFTHFPHPTPPTCQSGGRETLPGPAGLQRPQPLEPPPLYLPALGRRRAGFGGPGAGSGAGSGALPAGDAGFLPLPDPRV